MHLKQSLIYTSLQNDIDMEIFTKLNLALVIVLFLSYKKQGF